MRLKKFNEMTDNSSQYDELKKCMIDFKNAYNKLTTEWTKSQSTNEVDYILGDDYPFKDSFDEVAIPEWIDKGLERMQDLSIIGIVSHELNMSKSDVRDRFEEFDVIKDGNIDYIRLNSLYDFYKVHFSKSHEQRFELLPID